MKNHAYYNRTLADEKGISGDDLNRRHREKRLGFAPPSDDWADCNKEIRCVHPNQVITRPALDNRDIYVHSRPAYFNPDGAFLGVGVEIV